MQKGQHSGSDGVALNGAIRPSSESPGLDDSMTQAMQRLIPLALYGLQALARDFTKLQIVGQARLVNLCYRLCL